MTDDTFRLTALDVRRYDFGGALRGYDKARVEQFREQVAAELERLARAVQELDQKARNFHEQLRAFRDRDRALNEALISAQQLRSETKETAEREAELIRREARAEAEDIRRSAQEGARRHVEQLRGEQRRIEEEIAGLDRVHRTYIAQLRLLAERQLAELSAAEERTLPPPTLRRPALEAGREPGRSDVHPLDASALEAVAAELESAFGIATSSPGDPFAMETVEILPRAGRDEGDEDSAREPGQG
ncbi:MAG: DivIVA domain-containing protein [Gemmatirosa sp.]